MGAALSLHASYAASWKTPWERQDRVWRTELQRHYQVQFHKWCYQKSSEIKKWSTMTNIYGDHQWSMFRFATPPLFRRNTDQKSTAFGDRFHFQWFSRAQPSVFLKHEGRIPCYSGLVCISRPTRLLETQPSKGPLSPCFTSGKIHRNADQCPSSSPEFPSSNRITWNSMQITCQRELLLGLE